MKTAFMLCVLLLGAVTANADVPLKFAYQGKLTDSNGVPLASVNFKVQLFDPTGVCLLYEENHTSVSLGTQGLFNLAIGSSVTDSKRGVSDPGLTMEKIFSNEGGQVRAADVATCPGGYTPNSTDQRRMKVTVTNLANGSVSVMSPMQDISMSPYALLAGKASDSQKLQGKTSTEFIQTDSTSVNQVNVKSLTDKVSDLLSIVASNVGNKLQAIMTDYQGAGRITVADSPTAATDAVNKNYVDAKVAVVDSRITSESGKIAGKEVSASVKAPTVSEDGKVIAWSNAQNKYILQAAPSGSGSITSSDVTTALGYTPQQQSSELSGVAGLASSGIVQRTGAGAYTAIGTTAPINVTAGNIGISIGGGLTTSLGSIVPDFGTGAGKVAQGNDVRFPSSTCASGNKSRWDGSAWQCETDAIGGGSSQWTTSGSDIYYNTGKVGVGTTSPSLLLGTSGLQVVGSATEIQTKSTSSANNAYLMAVNDVNQWTYLGAYGSTNASSDYANNGAVGAKNSLMVVADGSVSSGGSSSIKFLTGGFAASTQTRMTIDSSGNVGIGTASPGYKLDVAGDVNVTGNFKVNGVNISSGGGTVTSVTAAGTAGNPITIGGTAAAPTIDIPKATTSVSGYLSSADWTTFNNKLSSITSGNVTTALGYTPQTQNAELTGLAGIATTGIVQRTGAGAYTGLGTAAPINVTAGNIGISIGTGLTTASNSIVPDFGTTAGKVAQGNDSRFPASNCASGNKMRWDAGAWVCETDATGAGSSQWITATNDIYYNTGNVGIGASSPDSALHVMGNARVTGQIASGSQTITSGTNAIDWNNGNAISTDYNCASNISFANLRDGGTYTLVVTEGGTTACVFNTTTTGLGAGTVSYRFKPANAVRTASSHSVYTFMRVGNIVYVSWASGF